MGGYEMEQVDIRRVNGWGGISGYRAGKTSYTPHTHYP